MEEDHIVSEEESFVESEEEIDNENVLDPTEDTNAEEVVVANIDDNEEPEGYIAQDRPRRANAGVGIKRLQMEFTGKGYGAQREFNFVANGETKKMSKHETTQHTYMQMATYVIFTQMSANKGFKKYGQAAVAAMIKEFTQLNEGAVPGNPVVRPTDVSSLTPLEKKGFTCCKLNKGEVWRRVKGKDMC